MIRVGVLGAAGRMGETACQAVSQAEDLELVAAVDPAPCRKPDGGPGVALSASIEALAGAGAEVAIDFTVADAAVGNLEWCAQNGVHAVCGTTGIREGELERLAAMFAAPEAPNAVVAANFSISAVVLMRLAEIAAPFFSGVEVIELHHNAKADAPSGTAIETARRIALARSNAASEPLAADPTTRATLAGTRGGIGPGGIPIHSVRLPGLVAHEEVLFGAPGQSLLLRQDSYDRTSFMPGVLLAVRRVQETPGLTLGLAALLGF